MCSRYRRSAPPTRRRRTGGSPVTVPAFPRSSRPHLPAMSYMKMNVAFDVVQGGKRHARPLRDDHPAVYLDRAAQAALVAQTVEGGQDAVLRDGGERAQGLGEQADAQFLEHPAGVGHVRRSEEHTSE